MRSPLTVAVAQPVCCAKNLDANAREHARLIGEARARVVVFPELSLTGYELDADALAPDDGALALVAEACSAVGAVALVGAPVAGEAGTARIGVLQVTSTGARVVYAKTHLSGDEHGRFAPGDGATTIEVDGWRIGLGVCKDTGVDSHVRDVAVLGIDLYAAGLLHLPKELAEQESRAVRIARACDAYVAFASFAGPAGGGYDRTAGGSSIHARDGTALVRAGAEPGCVVRATLDDVSRSCAP